MNKIKIKPRNLESLRKTKGIKNLLQGSNMFMPIFFKKEMKNEQKHIKLTKTFLNLLRSGI